MRQIDKNDKSWKHKKGRIWRVDKGANRVSYTRQFESLETLCAGTSGRKQASAGRPTVFNIITSAGVGAIDEWAATLSGKGASSSLGGSAERKAAVVLGRSGQNSADGSQPGPSGQQACKPSDPSEQQSVAIEGGCTADDAGQAAASSAAAATVDIDALAARVPPGQCPADILERCAANLHKDGQKNINASQVSAIEAALVRTCTLVQGPPGTGKVSALKCVRWRPMA